MVDKRVARLGLLDVVGRGALLRRLFRFLKRARGAIASLGCEGPLFESLIRQWGLEFILYMRNKLGVVWWFPGNRGAGNELLIELDFLDECWISAGFPAGCSFKVVINRSSRLEISGFLFGSSAIILRLKMHWNTLYHFKCVSMYCDWCVFFFCLYSP